MIKHYTEEVRDCLVALVSFLVQLATPISIVTGLLLGVIILVVVIQKDKEQLRPFAWQRAMKDMRAYLAVALFTLVAWTSLASVRELAQQNIRHRARFESTRSAAPDAPPVSQAGPSVAILGERTYTRSLTLPPGFLQRIGTEGVEALTPYLADPSATNVTRLRDSFRRSGGNVVFSRQTTVASEEPLPFSDSRVSVKFKRMPGRAYEGEFEGRYSFENTTDAPHDMHFLFTLPQAGTLSGLQVAVDGKPIKETREENSAPGTYEWNGKLQPGEKREAVVSYSVLGARVWSYNLGSARRRVRQFHLDLNPAGDVGLLRGSLDPSAKEDGKLSWDLTNVVSAQQLAIVFPQEGFNEQLYIMALDALPVSFVIFFFGTLWMGRRLKKHLEPLILLGALILFTFGLGSSSVLALAAGPIVGILVGPLLGALMAAAVAGRRSLYISLPAALLPVTFLNPEHSGLIILALVIISLGALAMASRTWESEPQGVEPASA